MLTNILATWCNFGISYTVFTVIYMWCISSKADLCVCPKTVSQSRGVQMEIIFLGIQKLLVSVVKALVELSEWF